MVAGKIFVELLAIHVELAAEIRDGVERSHQQRQVGGQICEVLLSVHVLVCRKASDSAESFSEKSGKPRWLGCESPDGTRQLTLCQLVKIRPKPHRSGRLEAQSVNSTPFDSVYCVSCVTVRLDCAVCEIEYVFLVANTPLQRIGSVFERIAA
jgi:hypothetical protein